LGERVLSWFELVALLLAPAEFVDPVMDIGELERAHWCRAYAAGRGSLNLGSSDKALCDLGWVHSALQWVGSGTRLSMRGYIQPVAVYSGSTPCRPLMNDGKVTVRHSARPSHITTPRWTRFA